MTYLISLLGAGISTGFAVHHLAGNVRLAFWTGMAVVFILECLKDKG